VPTRRKMIIIQPSHPLEYEDDIIQDYISNLRAKLSIAGIEVVYDKELKLVPGRYSVTYWQVLHINLTDIPDELIKLILAELIRETFIFFKNKFKKNKDDRRPKSLIVRKGNKQLADMVVANRNQSKIKSTDEYLKEQANKQNKKSAKPKRKKSTKKKKK
jgi:hypothetical protein